MRQPYILVILLLSALPILVKPGIDRLSYLQIAGETGAIDWPVTGEQINGTIVVRGSTPANGLRSYQLDYALSSDPNQAWVLVQEGTAPVQVGILAVWDTTIIPDGEYNLRLLVNHTNGEQSVTNMYNLLVNNTPTVEPTLPVATAWYVDLAVNTSTPPPVNSSVKTTATILYSATTTPFPANPVEISPSRAIAAVGGGAAFTIAIFIIAGGYIGIQRLLNGRK